MPRPAFSRRAYERNRDVRNTFTGTRSTPCRRNSRTRLRRTLRTCYVQRPNRRVVLNAARIGRLSHNNNESLFSGDRDRCRHVDNSIPTVFFFSFDRADFIICFRQINV